MTPTDLAKLLLKSIGAPPGAVSIIAEPGGDSGVVLRVWVNDSSYVPSIPKVFHGHRVVVEQLPRFTASTLSMA